MADAGKLGAVTIATNMAGRGTDIQLGGNVEMKVMEAIAADPHLHPDEVRAKIEAEHSDEKAAVIAAGGLFVLATERHESRRIDNQLRGRSGRQGDPGRSAFFLSLEDDLMRIFGSDRLDSILSKLGLKEGESIVHPWVNKSLERAQAKVEGRNFDIRKQLLKFDDVMNDQRKAIFSQRLEIMQSTDLEEIAQDMRHTVVEDVVDFFMPPKSYLDQWDVAGLHDAVVDRLTMDLPIAAWAAEEGVDQEVVRQRIIENSDKMMDLKLQAFGPETMRTFEKQLLLQSIDAKWREHLLRLEHLRSVVGFRGYAQRDPLNEYKSEAFTLFESMLNSLRQKVTQDLARIQPMTEDQQKQMIAQYLAQQQAAAAATQALAAAATAPALADASGVVAPAPTAPAASVTAVAGSAKQGFNADDPASWGEPGRNDQCPCGSGEKFKHCHGKLA